MRASELYPSLGILRLRAAKLVKKVRTATHCMIASTKSRNQTDVRCIAQSKIADGLCSKPSYHLPPEVVCGPIWMRVATLLLVAGYGTYGLVPADDATGM